MVSGGKGTHCNTAAVPPPPPPPPHISRLPLSLRLVSNGSHRFPNTESAAILLHQRLERMFTQLLTPLTHTQDDGCGVECSSEVHLGGCSGERQSGKHDTVSLQLSTSSLPPINSCDVATPGGVHQRSVSWDDHCCPPRAVDDVEADHRATCVPMRDSFGLLLTMLQSVLAGETPPSGRSLDICCIEGSHWYDVASVAAMSSTTSLTISVGEVDDRGGSTASNNWSTVTYHQGIITQRSDDDELGDRNSDDVQRWTVSKSHHPSSDALPAIPRRATQITCRLTIEGLFSHVPVRCLRGGDGCPTRRNQCVSTIASHLLVQAMAMKLTSSSASAVMVSSWSLHATSPRSDVAQPLSTMSTILQLDARRHDTLRDMVRHCYERLLRYLFLVESDGDTHIDVDVQEVDIASTDAGVLLELITVSWSSPSPLVARCSDKRLLPLPELIAFDASSLTQLRMLSPLHVVCSAVTESFSKKAKTTNSILLPVVAIVKHEELLSRRRNLLTALDRISLVWNGESRRASVSVVQDNATLKEILSGSKSEAAVRSTSEAAVSALLTEQRIVTSTISHRSVNGLRVQSLLQRITKTNISSSSLMAASRGGVTTTAAKRHHVPLKAITSDGSHTAGRTRVELHAPARSANTHIADSSATRRILPEVPLAQLLREQTSSISLASVVATTDDVIQRWRDDIATQWRVVGIFSKCFILLLRPLTDGAVPDRPLLCDQHAIHERLRLEYFLTYFLSFVSTSTAGVNGNEPTHSHSTHSVNAVSHVSLTINTFVVVKVWESAVLRHRDTLKRLGWTFCSVSSSLVVVSTPIVSIEGFVYSVTSPTALHETVEELEAVRDGATDDEDASRTIVPSVFLQILVSRSCRGAIMSGDSLSQDDAVLLVRSAATHAVNFLQCSHGRPCFATCSVSGGHSPTT